MDLWLNCTCTGVRHIKGVQVATHRAIPVPGCRWSTTGAHHNSREKVKHLYIIVCLSVFYACGHYWASYGVERGVRQGGVLSTSFYSYDSSTVLKVMMVTVATVDVQIIQPE